MNYLDEKCSLVFMIRHNKFGKNILYFLFPLCFFIYFNINVTIWGKTKAISYNTVFDILKPLDIFFLSEAKDVVKGFIIIKQPTQMRSCDKDVLRGTLIRLEPAHWSV